MEVLLERRNSFSVVIKEWQEEERDLRGCLVLALERRHLGRIQGGVGEQDEKDYVVEIDHHQQVHDLDQILVQAPPVVVLSRLGQYHDVDAELTDVLGTSFVLVIVLEPGETEDFLPPVVIAGTLSSQDLVQGHLSEQVVTRNENEQTHNHL